MSYKWFLKTKDVDKIYFYHDDQNKISPLEQIEDFDQDNYWSIDTAGNTFNGLYKIDPTENSFILIPKKDVIKIWSEEYEPPKIINKINTEEYFK